MTSDLVRLVSHARITPGCWEWQSAKNRQGYGRIQYQGKARLAHRLSWALHNNEPFPESSLVVMHRCDNPACINPEHLKLGTQAQNVADMYSKQRGPGRKGDKHPLSKLSDEDTGEIRRLLASGELKQKEIATMFQVGQQCISKIKRGQRRNGV